MYRTIPGASHCNALSSLQFPMCNHLSQVLGFRPTGFQAFASCLVQKLLLYSACSWEKDDLIPDSDLQTKISFEIYTDYVKHNHPPEELYFVLAPGDWWREDLGWRARPAGSIQHNPPHAWHAMRTGETPLLAVWCLWTADA